MSFSVAVWGRCVLGEAGILRWHKARISSDAYDDWKGDLAPGKSIETTVAKHLASWKKLGTKLAPTFLDYGIGPKGFEVRGVLDEDTFVSSAPELAAAFRAAAPLGGRGELVFCGIGDPLAYVVEVRARRSSLATTDQLEEWSPRMAELSAEASRRFDATPAGRKLKAATQAEEARAAVLPAADAALDEAAIDALLDALVPGAVYRPHGEPTRSALARLTASADRRIGERAHARLIRSWSKQRNNLDFYVAHLIELVVVHRVVAACAVLAKIAKSKSGRDLVVKTATRALAELGAAR